MPLTITLSTESMSSDSHLGLPVGLACKQQKVNKGQSTPLGNGFDIPMFDIMGIAISNQC
jgi:hypothetical protein